jgi:hypothetical protein
MTDDFAANACPTVEGIVDSLSLLRKRPVPYSDANLASRLDLLLLPFLRGLPSLDQRVRRLQLALGVAADRLTRDYEIVHRHVFLKPASHPVDERRKAALRELQEHESLGERTTSGTVKGLEDRMLPVFAEILLDPEFENQLDAEHPISRRGSNPLTSLSSSFRPIAHHMKIEIDDDDHRKIRLFRELKREILVPDQRVAIIRFHTRTSDPIEDSVKVLSDGHSYIGTRPDRQSAAVGDWMMHFIDLGGRKGPGDEITVTMSEGFFDEQLGERHPTIWMTANHTGTANISLGLRLPKAKRIGAKAEFRIVRNPHSDSDILKREPIAVTRDGWAKVEFPSIGMRMNHLYGIFFPDLDIYE